MSGPDLAGRLRELAELRATGVVDDEEYDLAKALLLGEPPPATAPAGYPPPAGHPAPVGPGRPGAPWSPVAPPGGRPPMPLRDHLSRPIQVAGYGMPLGLPVVVAVFVLLVVVAALLGAATTG